MARKTGFLQSASLFVLFLASLSSYAGSGSAFCEIYGGVGGYLYLNDVSTPGNGSQLVAQVTDSRGNSLGQYSSVQSLPPTTDGSEVTYTYQNTDANGDIDLVLKGTFKDGVGIAYSLEGKFNEGRHQGQTFVTALGCWDFNGEPTKNSFR